MDSIFYVGPVEEKLPNFLEKLGYAVIIRHAGTNLPDLVARTTLDLIVVDARSMPDAVDLCDFFRTQEATRQLPLVYIAPENPIALPPEFEGQDRIEILPHPLSVGKLAGRIATQLRMRKFDGRDELKSTLADVNATLRDFNDRFKKELEEARAIQEALLPGDLPSDPRVDFAVSYQPLEEVGGDWYFAKKMPDGAIALQIADVTGHGLSAAFLGSMAKLAMTAANTVVPHDLLKGMNALMAPQLPPGRFVTMGACLYDPATGALKWARAGHPPAIILRRATKTVEQLMGDGFAVGFFDDSEYSPIETALEPGDVLLIYTDGISEAQNRSMETYGLDRLGAALASCPAESSAAEMLSEVLDKFDTFREERILKDDVTAIVLKRCQ